MSSITPQQSQAIAVPTNPGRTKFLVGGLLIIAAIVYLIVSSTQSTSQYYYTIDELGQGVAAVGENVRISGAVIGESIVYDAEALELRFMAVNVPGDLDDINEQGGLAKVLYEAVANPNNTRVAVVYIGPKPDLLRHEAQAIMDGHLGEDGVFYADTLLLKCPTRYESDLPQAGSAN